MTDSLKQSSRELLREALDCEPTLDAAARKRMRESALSALAAGAVASAAVGVASAATKASTSIPVAASVAAKAGSFALMSKVILVVAAGGLVTAALIHKPRPAVEAVAPSAVTVAPQPTTLSRPVERAPTRAEAEPVAPPAPSAEAEVRTARPAALPSATASASSVPTAAVEPAPASTQFAVDVATLDRARGALNRGEAQSALAILDASTTSAAFAEERQALRVSALCAAGRKDEGRAELAKFRASFPHSLHTARAVQACETIMAPTQP